MTSTSPARSIKALVADSRAALMASIASVTQQQQQQQQQVWGKQDETLPGSAHHLVAGS
jgi:hypothetical protein